MTRTKVLKGFLRQLYSWSPDEYLFTTRFRGEMHGSCRWQAAQLEVIESVPITKKVSLWRYRNAGQSHWKVAKSLLTREEAAQYFADCDGIEPYGPLIEVPNDN